MANKNTKSTRSLREQIAAVVAHQRHSDALIDMLFEVLGIQDMLSSEFTAEELKDAGSFVAAHFRRRGAVNHLDLQIVSALIKARDGRDGSGIEPALLGTAWALAIPIVNEDKSGEGVFRCHECDAAGSPAARQEASPHPDGFGGARDASILASYDREGDFVFVQGTRRTVGLLQRAGIKRVRAHVFYKVPVKHCPRIGGLQLNGKAI